MRVLIVEDNAFNAFCLRRLLESMTTLVSVTIVNNSRDALSLINHYSPDIVILDGDLGAKEDVFCNGPELAQYIFQKYPELPLIAWSDSELMKAKFSVVFNEHNKSFNEYSSWPKVISTERIYSTWTYYFAEHAGTQHVALYQSSARYR